MMANFASIAVILYALLSTVFGLVSRVIDYDKFANELPEFPSEEYDTPILAEGDNGKSAEFQGDGGWQAAGFRFVRHHRHGAVCVKRMLRYNDAFHEVEALRYVRAKRVHGVVQLVDLFKMSKPNGEASEILLVTTFAGTVSLRRYVEDPTLAGPEFCYHTAMWHLLKVVRDLHAVGIMHRDITLANVIIDRNSTDSEIVLIDFGIAIFLQPNERTDRIRGPIEFHAPEALRAEWQGFETEMWMYGCVLLAVFESNLDGPYYKKPEVPVDGEGAKLLVWQHIRNGLQMSSKVPSRIKAFARAMLHMNAESRPTAADALLKYPRKTKRRFSRLWEKLLPKRQTPKISNDTNLQSPNPQISDTQLVESKPQGVGTQGHKQSRLRWLSFKWLKYN